MFVITMKKPKRLLLFGVLAGILAVGLTVGLAVQALAPPPAGPHLPDNAARLAFCKERGILLEEEPLETVEVLIPQTFDAVYAQYQTLQQEQGFDLQPYQGKAVRRYSYRVTNYPGNSENIRCNLYLYEERLVAGDVCSVELNGFMHGLYCPKEE